MPETQISLSQLSSLCGSDKHVHGFTEFYEKFVKDLDPQVVCEIGMGGLIPPHWEAYKHIEQDNPGGSSRMWLKYFPHSRVFVMDNFSQVTPDDVERVINELVQASEKVPARELNDFFKHHCYGFEAKDNCIAGAA